MAGQTLPVELPALPSFLLVRLGALGDLVHSMPVATALKALFPECRISWLVERPFAPLVRMCSAVDEVLLIDTRAWRKQLRSLLTSTDPARPSLPQLLRQLRSRRFDVALDTQGLLKSALWTRASGAALRVGFTRSALREPLSALATNRRVPVPSQEHVILTNRRLVAALVPEQQLPSVSFGLAPPAEARQSVARFLAELNPQGKPLLMLHPSAAWESKRMPWPLLYKVARGVLGEGRYLPLLAWAPGEEAMRDAFREAVPGLAVPPATSILELAALLAECAVFLGPDTGPMHLAAALGVRCCTYFGPTDPARNGPWGAGHRVLWEVPPEGAQHQRQLADPVGYWARFTPERLLAEVLA